MITNRRSEGAAAISRLSLLYVTGLLVLAAVFAAVVVHGTVAASCPDVGRIARLTGLPGPALAVSHFEDRWRCYRTDDAVFYPGMPRAGRLDFVYAP